MKFQHAILSATTIALLSTSALAKDNKVNIEQVNAEYTVADVDQSGAKNELSIKQQDTTWFKGSFVQAGNENALTAIATGRDNTMEAHQRGKLNEFHFNQSGTKNRAYMHTVGTANQVTTLQIGEWNNAFNNGAERSSITGSHNNVTITQAGAINAGFLNLTGDANRIALNQWGENNGASASISGSNNSISIQQQGAFHDTNLIMENSYNNDVNVSQQAGTKNSAFVHSKNASFNSTTIIQH